MYDEIVSAANYGDLIVGIASIAALLAAVFVVSRGVRMLLDKIRHGNSWGPQ